MTAADLITSVRLARRKLRALPAALRPVDEGAAYNVQDEAASILARNGLGAVIGYKIGCTTQVMQRYLNIDHPCAGYMYTQGLVKNRAMLAPKDFVRPGVECEIAVTLAAPLKAEQGPFTLDSIAPMIGAVHAAIELVDERYEDWGTLGAETLIADDFFHAGLILGPPVTAWRDLDLTAITGVTRVNGIEIARGVGADLLGHPLKALVWLANHCAARGHDVAEGSIVSLGSLTPVQWLSPGDRAEIEVDVLGALSCSVAR